ncbi:uncharacterized protein LOC126753043 [Bactrocera neohumeralis]|uniref:uncharacterized protein LOC126753043 n=1 Tax=Bactrocera neohumeralis TaxID=98809 RepID=UPI0021665E3B|nr:uncharacterized protein LOC126753043 [Bactrocera neohumeralis]XP_050320103.1 uncharacterized protein LOC126753043 [Bactrocera neohumeralis]
MELLIPAAKRQKRIKNFTASEKRKLIKEVEKWPRIWDTKNVMHSNKNALEQAWVHISNSLGKTVSECKVGWISLRESYRYHAKVARKHKSGSARGDPIDWEFAEEMSFLPNVSHKRRTSTSPTFEDLDSSSSINRANVEELIIPQFDYSPTPTTSNRTLSGSQNDEAWSRFNNILKKQEDLVAGKNNSPYAQALGCFDWLLNKLPQSVADDMCMEFNIMLLQKVTELKSKK